MARRPNIRISTFARRGIYLRDRLTCTWCGCQVTIGAHTSDVSAAALDHLVCYSAGGSDDPSNLVTACTSCNSRRGDTDLATWIHRLAWWHAGGLLESPTDWTAYDEKRAEIRRRVGLRRNRMVQTERARALMAEG